MDIVVVSMFDNFRSALEAVQELNNNGFDKNNVSLIAQEQVLRMSPRVERISPDMLLGKPYSAHLGGIGDVLSAGPLTDVMEVDTSIRSLADVLVQQGVPEDDANAYAEGIRRGGILVIVQPNESNADQAADIINRHDPISMEEQITEWRQGGWSRFDPDADPMDFNELDWPSNITRFPGENVEAEGERNWPETITGSDTNTEVGEEEASNWPHNITARPGEPRKGVDEEAETNWPHDITTGKKDE